MTNGPIGIIPTTDFRDDPWGTGESVPFRAGVMSSPVPAEFARIMRQKGLAVFGDERPPIAPPPVRAARKIARAVRKSASDKAVRSKV